MELSFAAIIFLCLAPTLGLKTVKTPGVIRGKTITTRNGRDISAYLGIPYAIPPDRFKPTRLLEGWSYIRMGDTEGNMCLQLNDDGEVIGSEDCLFLNVYTPETEPDKPYPTMVFIHGGFFVKGSGGLEEAGPEYLLDRDIVLVTINYRLGVLGFLSTGDAQAPGNYGLKDQAVALQWVQKYINAFGGDPSSVTIFGQCAGGASTALHAISEMSTGLFHRYIAQSGTGFEFWSVEERQEYRRYATKLGNHVNCPTDSTRSLVDCLKHMDAEYLVDSNSIFDDRMIPYFTWVPTTEPKNSDNAFLKSFPLQTILTQGAPKQPAIVGSVRDEGLLLTADFYVNGPMYIKITENLSEFVANATRIAFSKTKFAAEQAEKFYFEDARPDNKEAYTHNMTNFVTDLAFRNTLELFARVIDVLGQGTIPLFVYEFDYTGTYSKTSATIGSDKNVGVTHGDDLNYLFPQRNFTGKLSDNDERMIDIMIDFWTSFASTGTPTSDRLDDPNSWKRYSNGEATMLGIGDNSDTSVQSHRLQDQRLAFWNYILSQELVKFMSL